MDSPQHVKTPRCAKSASTQESINRRGSRTTGAYSGQCYLILPWPRGPARLLTWNFLYCLRSSINASLVKGFSPSFSAFIHLRLCYLDAFALRRVIAVPFLDKLLKVRDGSLSIPASARATPRESTLPSSSGSSATAYSQAFITWTARPFKAPSQQRLFHLNDSTADGGLYFSTFMKAALASVTRLLCSRFSPS